MMVVLLCSLLLFFFFFFQAEDGIRDGRVTGVQTCALPIYIIFTISRVFNAPRERVWQAWTTTEQAQWFGPKGCKIIYNTIDLRAGGARSEERRVGKECRSRWSRDH